MLTVQMHILSSGKRSRPCSQVPYSTILFLFYQKYAIFVILKYFLNILFFFPPKIPLENIFGMSDLHRGYFSQSTYFKKFI